MFNPWIENTFRKMEIGEKFNEKEHRNFLKVKIYLESNNCIENLGNGIWKKIAEPPVEKSVKPRKGPSLWPNNPDPHRKIRRRIKGE